MRTGRGLVGLLGGAAALFAFAVGAVSLTRIAGDYLGFPPDLKWTLTGSVDVAGIAGGVMWTGFTGRIRRIGRPMNIVCTLISGIGVGLDHAIHSAPGWEITAFLAGFFLPALVTWILHALSVMLDSQEAAASDRELVTPRSGSSDREVAPRAATASPAITTTSPTASLVASVGAPDREVPVARSRSVAAASREAVPTVRQAVTPVPSPSAGALPGPRPDWMSAALVASVVKSMRATGHPRPRYGETRLVRDHQLDDGSKIGSDRAKKVLAYINNHELWREPA